MKAPILFRNPILTTANCNPRCTPIWNLSETLRRFIRETGKVPSNTSVCSHAGRLVYAIRLIDYMYLNTKSPENYRMVYTGNNDHESHSTYILYDADRNRVSYIDAMGYKRYAGVFSGIEDMRLVSWDGILYGICHRPDIHDNQVDIEVYRFHDNDGLYSIDTSCIINTGRTEKNWVPVEDRKGTVLYDPIGICLGMDVDDMKTSHEQMDYPIDHPYDGSMCGSSQVMVIPDWIATDEDHYVAIVHHRVKYIHDDIINYEHAFVVYDKELGLRRRSQWFHFMTPGLEYCTGLCNHNHQIHITFSTMDGAPHDMVIQESDFVVMLNASMNGLEPVEPDVEHIRQGVRDPWIKAHAPLWFYMDGDHLASTAVDCPDSDVVRGIIYMRTLNIKGVTPIQTK